MMPRNLPPCRRRRRPARRSRLWISRPARPVPHGDAQNLSQLAAAAKQAVASQTAAQNALQSARASVVQATAAFANFNTPQQNVALLSDSSPFLLFPVRIETRFRAAPVTTPPPGIAVAAAAALRSPHRRTSCWFASIPTIARSTPSSRCSRSQNSPMSKPIG